MKRVALVGLLISSLGFAMQDEHVENPALAQQIKKQDSVNLEKKDTEVPVNAHANAKPVSANESAEVKKGFWARTFACCNGKTEKN